MGNYVGMKSDIKKRVEQCDICQQNKTDSLSPTSLLQPLPLSKLIQEDWTMDFIEVLPKARGVDVTMVVVDRSSKFAHFVTLQHPFTTQPSK